MRLTKPIKLILVAVVGVALFGGGILTSRLVGKKAETGKTELNQKQDVYVSFILEVYDKIKTDYWEKISDEELSKLFLLANDKLTGISHSLTSNDSAGVKRLTEEVLREVDVNKKKKLVTTTADMVMANLKPFGRGRLYSQKEEKSLSDTVNNINPTADYFKTLEVDKQADDKQIAEAFEKRVEEIKTTVKEATKAAEKVAEAKKAYEVLKNEDSRKVYEVSGVEPTIVYKLLNPRIFYVHLTKFSPTSLDEFVKVVNKADGGESLDTLIFDLRGNIGGAIDSLPYFLGPFIGPDSYAYQFGRQGIREDYKTRTGWLNSLVRYKKVVILIDGNTQSSAEVMAASLKKYNVGVVLGEKTKGWGTVERVIPLETVIDKTEKYSLYMVHRVTLQEDGKLIEGIGVEPLISIKDPKWKDKLMQYFNREEIVVAVEEVYKE